MTPRIKHPISEPMAELIANRFSALSEPVRIRLLDSLRERAEASVQELADAVDASHANASKHLNLLHAEGMVARRKEKTKTLYRIADPGVFRLCEDVCGGIERRLRELDSVLEGPSSPPRSRRRSRQAA
jgi:DNA-binding transcriptional ArsR family regulator